MLDCVVSGDPCTTKRAGFKHVDPGREFDGAPSIYDNKFLEVAVAIEALSFDTIGTSDTRPRIERS